MPSIRWSDEYQGEIDYKDKVNQWYSQAIQLLQEGNYTLLGKTVNVNNPKEVAAVLYLLSKDYELFHEKF
jgi:hypothetical protein